MRTQYITYFTDLCKCVVQVTRESFQVEETLTETLVSLDMDTKKSYGYQAWEFLIDCEYAGVACSAVL